MNAKQINGFLLYGPESKEQLIQEILDSKKILIAINAEKIYSGNNILRELSQTGIGYPDGIGAIIALSRKGLKGSVRIPGAELWLDIISKIEGYRSVYLIGSSEEVIRQTRDKLYVEFPHLEILGCRDGYLRESDIVELEVDLRVKKPSIVFVAQGSPRQELLMQRLQGSHNAIYMGLGGSFDVYTGNVKRAPSFFRENGLEWFYRLLSQPSRIRRQKVLLPFLIKLYLDKY